MRPLSALEWFIYQLNQDFYGLHSLFPEERIFLLIRFIRDELLFCLVVTVPLSMVEMRFDHLVG